LHCKKNRFADFSIFLIFYSVGFLNFDFQLDYCSLTKKKHFHTKNHPSNFIFLASREVFLFFSYECALSLAEITPYFVINVTKLGQFWKQKKISS
jgi:hypothetical protein